MTLPMFVVLKSIYNDKYLRYIHEDGPVHGFLQFSEKEVSSPYAKFEVEMAKTRNAKGLVHIRCCFNNKYLVRWTPNHWWIVAGADKPEEDQSKWSCTLFEALYVDGATHPTIEMFGQTIRFRHVQLGHYACLWRAAPPHDSCLYAGSPDSDRDWCEIYTFTDWESLSTPTPATFTKEKMALPRVVVLKSNYNDKYLRYIHEDGPVHGFLRFAEEEVSSRYAKYELKRANTSSGKGCVHIRCCYSNKYFARGSVNDWWIVAWADEPEEDQSKWSCTLFEPLYVDDGAAQTIGRGGQTIRFRHVQLGHYACLWRAAPPHDSCLYAGSPNPDKDQCDVYTIIDWESLSILPPKDAAFAGEKLALPRFVVLISNHNEKFLCYIHEDGEVHGFLQFSGEQVSSPYSKFELEMAKTSGRGLVHLRCCYNNKYFVRWSPNHWWIVAKAAEPEEDQSKWSCTLFEPVHVDDGAAQTTIGSVAQTIRFRHVQLRHYACLWRVGPPHNSCLFAGTTEPDKEQCDVYTIIDWESLSTPTPATFTEEKIVVLKSNYNDKYLRYIHEDGPVHGFLRFSEVEVSSRYVKYELKRAKTSSGNGWVHIRCCCSYKYFARASANDRWIVAWAGEPEEDQSKWSCTLFEPLYVNDGATQTTIGRGGQTIRFRHVQLGHYVRLRRAAPPYDSCLYAGSPNSDKDQCDVCTIIDWESLRILPPKDAVFAGEKMALPRFAVLKSNYNDKYLRYIHEDGEVHGFLQFSGEQVSSPYSKFELEMAKTSGKGLVHLRCCYNNKYFRRWSPNHWWIVAEAAKPEEDQSKWSCTLFEPLQVDDGAGQKIRFRHVQLRHYACLWEVQPPHNSCLFAGTTEPDKEQCDIYTIIDWESFTRETIPLPRFIVLKSEYNDKYLRYIHEDGQEHGFLQFSGEKIVSPYTKYEMVMAKTSGGRVGFGHLRCCYNNKYLVRSSPKHSWIVADADEPEENQSKWSCTLFEPLYEDVVAQTIRFRHVQSGSYACLWRAAPPHCSCLYAGYSTLDQDRCDVYTVIDWESRLIVPKHVAFKGNNDNYLSACWIKGHPYLQFSSSDIGDHTVRNEVITTPNGSIRIKSDHLRKFWRCNNNWILADADDSTSNNSYTSSSCNFLTRFFCFQLEEGRKQKQKQMQMQMQMQKQKQKQENKSPEYDMLFWPIKVKNNGVALRNLGNNNFCKILTADGKINCLSADASTISSEVCLKVEEAVFSRKICNVNFHLRDARIYDKSILTLATEDAINRTQEPKTVDVKLSYSESRTWNSSISLKLLGGNTTIQTTVPLIIAEGKIEPSGEFSGDYQWGESLTTHEEKVYRVSVPPMTMVRVNLIATKASCDIPFSYEQLDTTTLTSIQQSTETMDDGIYTGSNCFNFKCETEQEKL